MRPKVEMIITHLSLGGAENVALSVAERLSDRYSFEFFVVLQEGRSTPVGRRMAERLAAINAKAIFGTSMGFKRGGILEAAWRLRQRLKINKPSLVHVHTEIPELTLALAQIASPISRGIPVLRTIHNTQLWPQWDKVGRFVEKRLLNASVAGVSEAALESYDALRARSGFPPLSRGRRELIYNGVGFPGCINRPIIERTPKVLFAGRLEAQKGADLLIPILRRASEFTESSAEVTIAGSGSMKDLLQRQIAEAKLKWPIIFVDALPDLAKRLSEFDIVLMPSRFEGLPLLAVEAGLAGVPLVAARAPGLSEVYRDDENSYCEVGDVDGLAERLANCLSDLEAARMAAAKHIPDLRLRFSEEKMINKYRKMYKIGCGQVAPRTLSN